MTRKIEKKFYLHPITEADLIEKLEQLPHGVMTETVVAALRDYFGQAQESTPASALDLGQIRQVFEAVLDSKLAGLAITAQPEDKELIENSVVSRLDDDLVI